MAFDFGYPNKPADERGWPSGYPNCHEDLWVPLVAPNGVSFGRVHKKVAVLLRLLLGESIRMGYPPKAGQCWGSVCRCSHRSDGTCAEDSQGNPIPSNHSYGLAIDFNSIENPYGGTTHEMPAKVVKLFHDYGFRWLGLPIQDWQHFDFAGTPEDARRMTDKALKLLVVKGYKFKGKTYRSRTFAARALRKSLDGALVGAERTVKVVER